MAATAASSAAPGPAAPLPVRQRRASGTAATANPQPLGSLRASPTGSVKFTPSSDSSKAYCPTGSFRGSPVSATPTVLYPGTPSPMPMQYGSSLSFGVHAQDPKVAPQQQPPAMTPQPVQQGHPTQVVYMQPQQAAPMPVMMQPGHVPMVMQAPQQTMQGVMMLPQQVQTTVQTHSPGGTANSPGQVVTGDVMHGGLVQMQGVAHQAYVGDSPDSAGAAADVAALSTNTAVMGALPSMGSALHDGTGRCSPCAWFWKARGCQSGANCGYCHICPEGELKNRKKAKVQAIRMGAIEPAQRPQHGTAQARASLKLTTLL